MSGVPVNAILVEYGSETTILSPKDPTLGSMSFIYQNKKVFRCVETGNSS